MWTKWIKIYTPAVHPAVEGLINNPYYELRNCYSKYIRVTLYYVNHTTICSLGSDTHTCTIPYFKVSSLPGFAHRT
jgi:hypothetical protein